MSSALTDRHGIELLAPGGDHDEWLRLRAEGIGASEIAAVMGISPWDSPFSVYWRKKLGMATEPNEAMEWGLRHERTIAEKFAESHPEFDLLTAGLYRHPDHAWMLATPDRVARPKSGGPDELVQIKTGYSWDGWGEPGSGDVPVYYRAQVIQEAHVYGAPRVWLPVLVAGNSYREYVVDFDPADAEKMRQAGEEFMARLAADDPPDVDGSAATLATLKALHPSVIDEAVTVPLDLADAYWQCKQLLDDAQAAYDAVVNRLRAAMGAHRYAVADGRKVATRSVYETTRLNGRALRADHPDLYAAYACTSLTDKLTPAKEST